MVNSKDLSDDYFVEGQRIVKYTKNNDKMNIENHFVNIFKEILKDCGLQNYNHLRPITFFISVSSNGNIANLTITMSPDLFDNIGSDKIIEFESRIRNEYKFHPFINNKIKIIPVIISIKKDKLNEMFK